MSIGPELKRLGGQVSHLEHQLVQHKNNAERFKAERDQARDDLEAHIIADRLVDEENAGLTPRTITADELQEGQWVAAQFQSDDWAAGVTTRNSSDELVLAYSVPGSSCRSLVKNFKAFVLLADAPPQESEPKRLTVEDLDAAEVGSRLSSGNGFPERVKIESGGWEQTADGWSCLSSDLIDPRGRTLTPPESAHRGRAVKPEELREGDVYDLWRPHSERWFHGIKRGSGELWSGLSEPGYEIRLISRKPPVPSEHPVILVHRANLKYDEPVLACLMGDHWVTPDREKVFYTDSIQDWEPARVVPAGQEGADS